MTVPRSRRGDSDDDRGAVTAEFALVLPVALLVVGLVVGAIVLATHRVALTSTAWEVVRLEARGDGEQAAARVADLPAGTTVSREQRGLLRCVTLVSRPGAGLLAPLTVHATGCAAFAADDAWAGDAE